MNFWTLIKTRIGHLRNARKTRAEIEAQQLVKFRRLISYVQKKSPYYRDLITEHKIDIAHCTPTDFPELTKTELIKNFDRIVTDPRITHDALAKFLESSKDPIDLFEDEFTVTHTSGSSGEIGIFVFSMDDLSRGLAQALRVNPVRRGKRRLAFFGAANGHFAGVSFAAACRRSLLKLKYEVVIFDINSPIRTVIEGLNTFQPDILMGYPSCFAILAERQNKGELSISPKWVQSSGEPISTSGRALIESAFQVPMLNVYVCTEHMIMGLGKAEYDGIYLFEDDLIFELERDHTLVTNLFNFTLPLIRYRMTDVVEKIDDPSPIFPFTKIKEVAGRNENTPFFINQNGEEDFVGPAMIVEIFIKNIRRFQFRYIDKTSFNFLICLEDDLSEAEKKRALEELDTRLGEIFSEKEMTNVTWKIDIVDDLRPDPKTGKFRMIVMPED